MPQINGKYMDCYPVDKYGKAITKQIKPTLNLDMDFESKNVRIATACLFGFAVVGSLVFLARRIAGQVAPSK